MTKATHFREVNLILQMPGSTKEQPYGLPIMHNGNASTSCWELSDEEVDYIVKNKKVWVQVMGNAHPALCVIAENPLRDDITEFTQFRIRDAEPTIESIKKAGITKVSTMFMDGQRVWERPHNIVDPNSDQYRKDCAEKLLEVMAKGIVEANEGFAKMNSHKLYKILFEDRTIVPDTLKFGVYIKREKFIQDMRNDVLPVNNNFEAYMFLE